MGGTVFCRSESGSGSAFGVRLPLVSAEVYDQFSESSPVANESAVEGQLGVQPVEFPATFQASVNASESAAFVPGDPLVGRLSSGGVVADATEADGGKPGEGDDVVLPS